MLAQVWQNVNGRDAAWKFVKKNWKEIVKRYGEGGFISRLLSPLEGHKTNEDLKDIKKFFKENIEGYTYISVDPTTLTVGTDNNKNIINVI